MLGKSLVFRLLKRGSVALSNKRKNYVRPRKAGGETCAVSALREAQRNFVAKKRGNPNCCKPEVNTVPYASASSFEEVVKKLRLSPAEYESSIQLKDWVRKNKDHKYVPLTLLQAWGLEVKGES